LGELLGLTWADVDLDEGVVRVRRQIDREGNRVEPKTPQAKRAIVLMPALSRLLREHRIASPYSAPGDFVFASQIGEAMEHRNVAQRGLDRAVRLAELDDPGKPKLRFHDLRDGFASALIAQGADVVFLSRQLGHASPQITLGTYAHLYAEAAHATRQQRLLNVAFGEALEARPTENGGVRHRALG